MKLENTKNAARTISTGVVARAITMLLQFAFRTVFIHRLGVEYLGLNSLFTSILNVLNLAELGLCASIVYCMYKPIAEDNHEKVAALMQFFRNCYRAISGVILVGGLAFIPFLKILVKGDLPNDVNFYTLYLLILGNTVVSYNLSSYKICVLNAYQRVDIKNKISIYLAIVQYITQIILIFIIPNYYLYLVTNIIYTMLGNVLTGHIVDRCFPYLRAHGKIDKDTKRDILTKVKGMMVYKLSSVLTSSFDTFVISGYLGLTVLGKFNNYSFISSSVASVLGICTSSITPGIGNNLVVKNMQNNYQDFLSVNFVNSWIVGWCTTCILCLSQNFISVWAGEDFLLSLPIVIENSIVFLIAQNATITDVYRSAAGIWDKDKFRPIVAAFANLSMNFVLVRYMGIAGVLLSTILVSCVFNIGWSTKILFREVFKCSPKEYYTQFISFVFLTIVSCSVTFWCTMLIPIQKIWGFILRGAICVLVPNVIYLIGMRRLKNYEQAKKFVLGIFRNLRKKH